MIHKKIKSAFTLVELIIVITILAILATIGFMSYQSYTADARDWKRLSDLWEIRNGLEVYQIKNQILPYPDNQVTTITSASWDLSYQWYASWTILKTIRMTSDIKDSKDKIAYTYTVNSTKTKYQLLALLENKDTIKLSYNSLFNQVFAANDYTTRYPYTIWNKVWVMLNDTTNTPIQESTWTVNLSTDTTIYKLVFTNSTTNSGVVSASWTNLVTQIQTIANSTITSSSSWNWGWSGWWNTSNDTYLWLEQTATLWWSPIRYVQWDHWWPNSYSPIDCDSSHTWWQYWIWRWICDNWVPIDWNKCKDDIWNIDDTKRIVKNNTTWVFLNWTYQNKPVYYLYTCTKITWNDLQAPTWWDFKINNWKTISNSIDVILNITPPKDDISYLSNIQIAYWNTENPTNWTNFSVSINHTLSSWDWTKIVYVRFKDEAWNISNNITKSITLNSSCTYDIIKLYWYSPNRTITINNACWPIMLNLITYDPWTTSIINNSWKSILKINYITYNTNNVDFNITPLNWISQINGINYRSSFTRCYPWNNWLSWTCDTSFDTFFNSYSLNQDWNRMWIDWNSNITIN